MSYTEMAKDRHSGAQGACPLRAAARRVPEAPALIGPDRTWSYAALDGQVTAAAAQIHARGWAEGARVALYGTGRAETAVLLWALLRAGAVACPISTRTPPAGLDALVQTAGCRALLTGEDVSGKDASEASSVSTPVAPAAAMLDAPPETTPAGAAARWDLQQPATAVFTSGSTGRPKAALHTLGNHYYSALGSNVNIPLRRGDRWLLSLPLWHVGGLAILFRCVLAEAAVVAPAPSANPAEVLRRERITHVSLVETQLRRLLRARAGGPPPSLKAVLLGGGAIAPDLIEEARARQWPLHTSYGLTEMASQVTATPPGASLPALRTAGRVLKHREVRIRASGEIQVRGRTLFVGYLEDGAPRRPVDADGWFATGDLGRLDAEGRVHVEGRAGNRFISGGENIQPEEIEAALHALTLVAEAVVVPVADAEFGARPVAFVRAEDGVEVPEAALRARLEAVLPRFKIPVAFYPWPEDAPNESGLKPDRAFFRVRAQALDGSGGMGEWGNGGMGV